MSSDSSISYDPHASESDIPLTAHNKPYQQWDRPFGYTGDSTETLHAPQPQIGAYGNNTVAGSYPRDEEDGRRFYGAVDEPGRGSENGHSRMGVARASTDEVGWDMGRAPDLTLRDPYDTSLANPPRVLQPRSENNSASRTPPRLQSQLPPGTEVAQSSTTAPPTETSHPSYQSFYPSPFDDPPHGASLGPSGAAYHGQEPTDSTFRTAASTMHSREGTEESVTAGPGRSFSPTPPSYRSNAQA